MTRMLMFSLLLAACGDNYELALPDGGGRADSAPADAYVPTPLAVAVSGDFNTTGIMTKLDIDTLTATMNIPPVGGVAGDPVIRKIGEKVYVINRFGGNSITVYNAKTLAFEEQFGTGANTNPQDVAVVGSTLYVPVLGGQGVVKVATADGATTPLDLATALGDLDGNPDCVSAYAVGTKVYVACGLLTNFAALVPGKVAVIDTANNDAITSVTLPYANPQNFFVRTPETSVFLGDLLISTTPNYSNYATGCVARVSTGATPAAACAAGLTNDDLDGYQTHLDVSPDGELLWLAVGTVDSNFQNPTGVLRGFDLTNGVLWNAPTSAPSHLITDTAACPDGSVVAIDRTMNAAGMRVYKNNVERTTAALSIGLPPSFGNNVICYDAGMP